MFSKHDGNNMPPLRSVDKHAKSSLQCSVYFELSNAFANKKTTDGAYTGCVVLSKNGFDSCWKVGTKLSHWNTSGPSSRCEKLLPVVIFNADADVQLVKRDIVIIYYYITTET